MRGAYDDHEFVMVCPVAYSGDHLVPRPAVLHIAGCERDQCGVARSVMPALELQELFNKFACFFLVSSPSGLAASDSWILKMAETVLCHSGVAGVGKWRLLGLPLRLSQAANVSLLFIVGCKQAEKRRGDEVATRCDRCDTGNKSGCAVQWPAARAWLLVLKLGGRWSCGCVPRVMAASRLAGHEHCRDRAPEVA